MQKVTTYKPRSRSEIIAWLDRARQRNAAGEEKMQRIFKEEEALSQRLRGIVGAPNDFDYKVELAER